MEFLASDALQGRGSGTHDEQLAATYIGAQMARWGIEPLGDNGGYVQEVTTTRAVSQTPPVLTVQNLTFKTGPDISVAGSSPSGMSGPLYKYEEGKPIPAGSFVLLPEGTAVAQVDTAGAVGVMSLPAPPAAGRAGGGGGGGGGGGARGWQRRGSATRGVRRHQSTGGEKRSHCRGWKQSGAESRPGWWRRCRRWRRCRWRTTGPAPVAEPAGRLSRCGA